MSRQVLLPPDNGTLADGTRVGGWWHDDESEAGRIVCDLCPRDCHLRPGDRGFCFVRENRDGRMVLSTYGRSTGFCIDPIEKKPLNHFYPGTSVLSFGTAGCNLGCKFCQNWSISKSREIEQLSEDASPEAIATAALKLGCKSVAFTYNDPVVWAEYAIDAARACRAAGVKTVAVTAGYITPAARPAFYEHMDAANVDLKGFTEKFYRHLTLSHLEPVKETLQWLVHESPVWTEITNLIIPRENDSPDELKSMCDWILAALGPNVPVHFTAFHPDFRLMDRERTPAETLLAAHDIATRAGLNYVYVGNIQARSQQTTHCPGCRRPLVEREGYNLRHYALDGSRCRHCGTAIHGHWGGGPGNWGSRRQPVRISQYQVRPAREYAISPGPAAVPTVTTKSVMTIQPPPVALTIESLTAEHERSILRAACRLLAAAVSGSDTEPRADELPEIADLPVLGVFVSLKRAGKLRSCCGFLGQNVPLAKALASAARRTACEDHRFPPIAARELAQLDVEVWLLHNLEPISAKGEDRRAAVKIGRHGLQIAHGNQRGLLLPGVAVENGFDAETFLQHVSLKAELPASAWREDAASLATFEGRAIAGSVGQLLDQPPAGPAFSFTERDLAALAEFCHRNLLALLAGATPNYFAMGLADGNVHGAIVSLVDAAGNEFLQANRLSIRSSLPLQSTLFGLTENLAQMLQRMRLSSDRFLEIKLLLTILREPAMHGTAAEPDLRGFDPARHMLLAMERGKTAGLFDPAQNAEKLVAQVARAAQAGALETTQLFSLPALAQMPQVKVVHVPRPTSGPAVRPAGVAGRFYPADPEELARLVDRCMPSGPVEQRPWPALMVPHAGLIYSGRIAADTLRRAQIPSTVIVIGPKHTPQGVEWAIAPHQTWSIPGATLAADPQLAHRLVEAIPGLALDAVAHAQEHAVEVELPFLARLAPQAKVVGIALGGSDLPRCRQFAAGLAQVVRSLPERPLLVISSDMNHFASDAENRRLDEIALAAMESCDPEQLYGTVKRHHISMCGVVPAVIVMETLRLLGQLERVERVAYATSADVSGDKSRVVGYAGMLLG
ncbi:MAG: AmmeMemoRadiSam system radical SAM enzyme [Planctomycetaceae bacterium]|nr:AmmeMemoRadiSam system radical SAM enzyme [Planctomycetaceae bacterium]